MDKKETKKPLIFLILKIIGFALLAAGICLFIYSSTIKVPEMGHPDWFDKETLKGDLIFGAIAICMISVFILIASFMPAFSKVSVKTARYIQDENKEDLKAMATTQAEISEEAIAKSAKAIKRGFQDSKFCKYCGQEIDSDSVFCSKCGKEQ